MHTRLNSAERKNHTNKNKERTKNKERHTSYASAYKGTKWHVSTATKVLALKGNTSQLQG